MTDQEKLEKLRKHIFAGYRGISVGMWMLGVLMPVMLAWIGKSYEDKVRESWSAYYYGPGFTNEIFIGFLFAIGMLLILYKGFSQIENWLFWVAGLASIMVACLPMNECKAQEYCLDPETRIEASCYPMPVFGEVRISAHGVAAAVFFAMMALAIFLTSRDTLKLLPEKLSWLEKYYKWTYFALGVLILVMPGWYAFVSDSNSATFLAESWGAGIFSFYWIIKSLELWQTRAEHLALAGGPEAEALVRDVATDQA